MEKKYTMIITAEDERYEDGEKQLDFFGENPWEGRLEAVVFGDSVEELFGNHDYEGLFYQLYITETGERIGYGILTYDALMDDICFDENIIMEKTYRVMVKKYGYADIEAETPEEAKKKVAEMIDFEFDWSEIDWHDAEIVGEE